jgi:DNA-binding CsgD family transcriptional regulator
MGKTTLCDYAVEVASGFRVIALHGVETELALPLAGLSDVAAALADSVAGLSSPARAVLASLAGRLPASVADPMALGAATLQLLGAAAESGPLLVVVDDLHWIDEASVGALVFAVRRLDHDAVAVLLASRPPLALALEGVVSTIELRGLDAESALELVRSRAGGLVDDRVATALVEATDANPLALSELPALLSADQLLGRAPLPDHLPLGERSAVSFGPLLRRLPESSRLALAVVGAAGWRAYDFVPGAFRRLGLSLDDLAPAEQLGLCEFRQEHIVLRHVLVGAAALESVGSAEARRVLVALADASAHVDFERSVTFRAQATVGSSEELALDLERAAARRGERGGAVGSAPLLARAAQVSPPGPTRWRRLEEAATANLLAGHPQRACELAEKLRRECDERAGRARATLILGQASIWRPEPPGLNDELWDLTQTADAPTAVQALVALSFSSIGQGDMLAHREALDRLGRMVDVAPPDVRLLAEATIAVGRTFLGERSAARDLVRMMPILLDNPAGSTPLGCREIAAIALVGVELPDQARLLATTSVRSARAVGAVLRLPFLLSVVGDSSWWLGEWRRARAALDEAVVLANQTGQRAMEAYVHCLLARLHAGIGDRARVDDHAAVALRLAEPTGYETIGMYVAHARGLCALACGDPGGAAVYLRVAYAATTRLSPYALVAVPTVGDFIESLILSGVHAEAQAALAELADRGERLESPFAQVVVARLRGLLEPESWDAWFEKALLVEGHGVRFEKARARLAFGGRLRRDRRIGESRDQLTNALDEFGMLGATVWADRTAAELNLLRSTPVTRTSDPFGDLTPKELQVCLAVADGMTNREAARSLFLSTKTVETHLGRAFRKLGITSRTQLTRLVARSELARSNAGY